MRPPRPRPCDAAPPRKANPLAAVDGGAVVAIGSSTGGTEALGSILSVLPDVSPGIVIVQHMPAAFTAALASRLDKLSALEVIEGRDGDEVRRGRAIIAPGDRHLRIRSRGGRFEVVLGSDEPVNRHKPSVDVLFESVAGAAGAASVGVLLTGMGADGAAGLLAMRRTGAHTIAQDEATSVVYGMPRAAAEMGAAVDVLPLDGIPAALLAASMQGLSV